MNAFGALVFGIEVQDGEDAPALEKLTNPFVLI